MFPKQLPTSPPRVSPATPGHTGTPAGDMNQESGVVAQRSGRRSASRGPGRRALFTAVYLCFAVLLCTCDRAPATQSTAPEAPGAAATPGIRYPEQATYPSIDFDKLAYLWNNATYMDATFYKLPISINQNNLNQIRATIAGIAEDPAVIDPGCEPAGHIWFQVDGKNVEEADIYFQRGCTAYVWYENGKPAYSNQMTEGGVEFYNNIMQSLRQQAQ